MPLVALPPLQPPLAVQAVAFVLDHVNVELLPEAIVVGPAVSVIVGMETLEVTVTAAVALFDASAREIAFIVTVAGDGTVPGAVY